MKGGSASSPTSIFQARSLLSSTTDHPSSPIRARRSDARRNREKILAAAAAAFAGGGLDAQVEDIARRAGLGVGTVYRHFPTKEALVSALAQEHFERLAGTLEAALDETGDAWEIFTAAIWRAATAAAGDVAWCEIIAGDPGAVAAAARGQERVAAATATLIARAQAAGAMRRDATVEDVATMMCGFGHIAAGQRAGGSLDWRRYLSIALDGLRAR